MRSSVAATVFLALIGIVAAFDAPARQHTQFRWVDGSGTPHFSDTLTMDALQYGYDVLSDKGVVVKHVDRQRTPEELFAEEAAAAAAAAQKREAEAQAQSEKRMLAAYPEEKDFIAARQAQLDGIDQNIRAANNSLGVQEKSLSDALAQASGFEHSNKPVPDPLKRQIESLRKSAESLRAYVGRRQQEKADAAKRFETDLQRYRAARARSALERS